MEQARPGAGIRIIPTVQRTAAPSVEAGGGHPGASPWFSLEEWRAVARERYNWDLQSAANTPGPSQFVCQYSTLGEGEIRFHHSWAMAAVVRPFDARQARLRLVYLLSGRARITARDGNATLDVGQGDLFLLNTGAVKQVEWSAHSDLCLQLPGRCCVTQSRTSAVIPITDAVIARPLKAMLRLLAARGADLDADARERALLSLADMTMLGLSTPNAAIGPPQDGRDVLLAKAQLYLRAHFRRTDLSVDEVAAAVACSRTSLYRLFAARSLTVMGYLREMRLLHCRDALAVASAQANIAQIAYRHGFVDLHSFTRLFKRRFGMTPGQVRAAGP